MPWSGRPPRRRRRRRHRSVRTTADRRRRSRCRRRPQRPSRSWLRRSSLIASVPTPSGRSRSSTTTCGRSSRACRTASATVDDMHDVEPVTGEQRRQHAGQVLVVLDDEDRPVATPPVERARDGADQLLLAHRLDQPVLGRRPPPKGPSAGDMPGHHEHRDVRASGRCALSCARTSPPEVPGMTMSRSMAAGRLSIARLDRLGTVGHAHRTVAVPDEHVRDAEHRARVVVADQDHGSVRRRIDVEVLQVPHPGQREPHGRTAAERALGPDPAAVTLHDARG